MIEIFSTSRAVRDFYKEFSASNTILQKAITISEFESKAWYVPDLILADEDTRILIMQEAVNFDSFSKLKIPTEFMVFMKNSNYLFSFFEELASELVDIKTLQDSDIYGEFNEHILILQELLKRYESLLESRGMYDKITLPKKAKLNTNYLKSLKKIKINLEGYLNNFEYKLIEEACEFCEILISTPINKYNKKIQNWLDSYDIKTQINTFVTCNLNTKTLLLSQNMQENCEKILFKTFHSRTLQAAFVFEQIERMVELGISPENIAIVLPDENFVDILKELDVNKNLNFAMGKNFKHTNYFKKLNALSKYFNEQNTENKSRLERLRVDTNESIFLSQNMQVEQSICWFKKFINEEMSKNEIDIINEELFLFERFLVNAKNDLKNSELLTLFLNRLGKKSLDDVSGGKITVLGVLELRGSSFEGLIIVDFNDDIVPRRSEKDMFLSSHVRTKSNLPSIEDRENLQRFFYDRAIESAKFVSICCVETEEKLPSRFLKNLNTKVIEIDESLYFDILFKKINKKEVFTCENLKLKHDFFSSPLSSSRLKCFLDCPRKYYFKYILKFQEARAIIEEFEAKDMGNILHDSLKELFLNGFNSISDMQEKMKKILHVRVQNSEIAKLNADIWLYKLGPFFEREMKNKEDGWKVYKLEETFTCEKNNFFLTGKIDRIDIKDGVCQIYDYKSGKINEEKDEEKALNGSDFQLEFYSFLCEDLGILSTPYYYKLDEAKLIGDNFFEQKKEKLLTHLQNLKNTKEFDFVKTKDLQKCTYCAYITICKGEINEI